MLSVRKAYHAPGFPILAISLYVHLIAIANDAKLSIPESKLSHLVHQLCHGESTHSMYCHTLGLQCPVSSQAGMS